MDAGFYRGTSTEQDIRFTDKERKLLKQMKFEQVLEQKVDLQKVNLDVIKPWITLKLNEILGMEDDVVVEYVFTQLEEKELNPKKMQINLTGFLNARRAREFMGELWHMFAEAQNSPEGIPTSLVERKVQELKIANAGRQVEHTYAKATEIDWAYRYKSLTGGRYGKTEPRYEVKVEPEQPDSTTDQRDRERDGDRERERDRERRRREREEEREERAQRRLRYEEERFMERKDLLREKQRQEEREERRRARRRSPSSDESPAPPLRRFTESGGAGRSNNHDNERDRKKSSKKSHKRHHSDSEEEDRKKAKKHKKDKKSKKHKERD